MNEILEQFVVETRELAEQAMQCLLELERAPANKDALNDAFRAFHTMKGGAGIVDFGPMAQAVHAAEDALTAIRSGDRAISSNLISDCLACVDQVNLWLEEIEAAGDLPNSASAAAEQVMARFRLDVSETAAPQPSLPQSANVTVAMSETAFAILREQLRVLETGDAATKDARILSAGRVARNVLRHSGLAAIANEIERAIAMPLAPASANRVADILASVLDTQTQRADVARGPAIVETSARFLRVDASRVDSLANAVGELVVAKNTIGHIAKLAEERGDSVTLLLREGLSRMERTTKTIQDAVVSLRVLPLRTVFQRFLRVTRELAVELDKPATLVIEGDETEADKTIVEMLFEPLLHVVRNAMDHGIEPSSARLAAGKPVVARLTLRARRSGEHVVVEVEDDGRGIDVENVRSIAVARGLMSEEAVAGLDDAGLIDLIFMPGFSTAHEVTGMSGRGVGMDAVRTAIARIGGHVEVESRPAHGTRFSFVLPFSVMMTRVMTVEAGGQSFGIPLESVVETVRIPRARVEGVGKAEAFVLRDQTIPLINLAETLGRAKSRPRPAEVLAVIVSFADQIGAVEVDRLGDRLDIMLKPAEGLLAGTPAIAGTTLTGDGQVLLILDLLDVFS